MRRGLAAAGLALAAVSLLGTATGCGGRGALAAVGPPLVRVQLGAARPAATLTVAGSWSAVDDAGRRFRDEGRALSTTISTTDAGLSFRGSATGAWSLRIRPEGPFTLDKLTYRGELVARADGGKVVFTNELDLETYVEGVIVNELGPDRTPAAYRAQAVAARTYAYRCAMVDPGPDAPRHLYDDEKDQVYRGLFLWPNSTNTLADLERYVRETRGVVLQWHGRPICAYYCSTCGGHTCDCATAGLDPHGADEVFHGVPCWYCTDSKYYAWNQVVTADRLLEGLKPRGVAGPLTNLEITRTGPGGRAAEVTVTFGPKASKKRVPANEIRSIARLKSARWSTPVAVDDGWQFAGYGFGHGVGMCQMGAVEMSRRGFTDADILRYYYPGADVVRLY